MPEFRIAKVDRELGLLFGWAIVCTKAGEPYFDVQGDHIPEDAMLKAAAEFMQSERILKLMHKGDAMGQVMFAWPLTSDIAKKFGIESGQSGLMIAVKPDSKATLDKFSDGELRGFSIGGLRIEDEEVST